MLLGAITPDERHDRHRRPPPARRAGRGRWSEVGFVAGYLPLPDRLRVREALSIFAGFYGLGRKAGEAAVDAGLERFRIAHLADRMCMELSSGQRTLVGIVKAILHRPRAARARRAHGLPRPRRRRTGCAPACSTSPPTRAPRCSSRATTCSRSSGSASGSCSSPAAGRRRRHARRGRRRASATATSRACSSTSPARSCRGRDPGPRRTTRRCRVTAVSRRRPAVVLLAPRAHGRAPPRLRAVAQPAPLVRHRRSGRCST